jgi:hypothetical protein
VSLDALIGKPVRCKDGLTRRLTEVGPEWVRYEFQGEGGTWRQPGQVPLWQALNIFDGGEFDA